MLLHQQLVGLIKDLEKWSQCILTMVGKKKNEEGGKYLHNFVWRSNASPVFDVFGGHDYEHGGKEVRVAVSPTKVEGQRDNKEDYLERDDFSVGNRGGEKENRGGEGENELKVMPPTSVMTRLILIMVWIKLIGNPNI